MEVATQVGCGRTNEINIIVIRLAEEMQPGEQYGINGFKNNQLLQVNKLTVVVKGERHYRIAVRIPGCGEMIVEVG